MQLSVVIPMYNEAECAVDLAREVAAALDGTLDYELVIADDGSTDSTYDLLLAARSELPRLRVVRHLHNAGQSAAIVTGVRAARAPWIATLDGDGQNDPADIPMLYAVASERPDPQAPLLVAGTRRKRNDNWLRRFSSRVANGVRQSLLHDDCPDTGCGLKVFPRDLFLRLPHFNHLHRFMPALFRRAGVPIVNVSVNHRPRVRGSSKYGVGNRLWVGIVDLFGVMWLQRRPVDVPVEEAAPLAATRSASTLSEFKTSGTAEMES